MKHFIWYILCYSNLSSCCEKDSWMFIFAVTVGSRFLFLLSRLQYFFQAVVCSTWKPPSFLTEFYHSFLIFLWLSLRGEILGRSACCVFGQYLSCCVCCCRLLLLPESWQVSWKVSWKCNRKREKWVCRYIWLSVFEDALLIVLLSSPRKWRSLLPCIDIVFFIACWTGCSRKKTWLSLMPCNSLLQRILLFSLFGSLEGSLKISLEDPKNL